MANRFLSNIRINDAYTFPASDGTNNQVIKTDGSGNLSFGQLAADSASVMYKDTFTGDGSTSVFSLANALNDEVQSNIYIDGVYQSKSTYSVSGTAITFSTAPLSGHEIEVISTTGINSGPTAIYTDTFTANGSTTAFTLAQTVHSENQTIVFLNGVYQFKGTYTLSGTTLTLDTAPANGVSIEVMSIGSAYSGGDILYDHDFTSAGLMTTNGSGVYSITTNNSANWNTAYGWGDHSTQSYATQSYVGTQISNLVDSSPATLDTLNELAAALGDDPNFATTTANSIGLKAPLASPSFTGNTTFAGNVGIGAAASDGNLHVRKTGINTGITNVLMNANFADGSNGTGLSIGYRTDETTAVLAARTATGNIAFYSYDGGWSESMRIKNTGNVGIGTDTPSALLEIQTAGTTGNQDFQIFSRGESPNYEVFKISRAAGSTELLANQNLTLSADYDANHTSVDSNIFFKTDNTEKMRIDSSGNVGIGDTSPDYRLSVKKVNAATPAIMVSGAHYGGPRIQTYGLDADSNAWMGLGTDMSGAAYEHNIYFSDYNSNGRLSMGTYNGTTYSEKMCILRTGNVGIGITSPQDKLHVSGDAIISGTRFGDFSVASISTIGYAIANISASTNGQSAIVEFVASGNNGDYYNVVYSCYNGSGVWYYTKNVVGSGGNIEVAETNGGGSSTLVFYFRATSGVASYTPRVMMKGMPYNLVTF